MPALSPTMEAGTIAAWKVAEGESFKDGDVLAEVETDKATVDFVATDEIVVAKLLVAAGAGEVKVGEPVIVVVEEAGDVGAFASYTADAAPAAAAPAPNAHPRPRRPRRSRPRPRRSRSPRGRPAAAGGVPLVASPLARALALDKGFDLAAIAGSGPGAASSPRTCASSRPRSRGGRARGRGEGAAAPGAAAARARRSRATGTRTTRSARTRPRSRRGSRTHRRRCRTTI